MPDTHEVQKYEVENHKPNAVSSPTPTLSGSSLDALVSVDVSIM